MPSTSKSQQRLFGMVHAYQKGKLKHAPAKVREIARHISEEDAKHFAKTRHDGLPERRDREEEKAAAYVAGFLHAVKQADENGRRSTGRMAAGAALLAAPMVASFVFKGRGMKALQRAKEIAARDMVKGKEALRSAVNDHIRRTGVTLPKFEFSSVDDVVRGAASGRGYVPVVTDRSLGREMAEDLFSKLGRGRIGRAVSELRRSVMDAAGPAYYPEQHTSGNRWYHLFKRLYRSQSRNGIKLNDEFINLPGKPSLDDMFSGGDDMLFNPKFLLHELGHAQDAASGRLYRDMPQYNPSFKGWLKDLYYGFVDPNKTRTLSSEIRAWDNAGIRSGDTLREAALDTYRNQVRARSLGVPLGVGQTAGAAMLFGGSRKGRPEEKKAAYAAGFISKCVEHGVDGRRLLKLAAPNANETHMDRSSGAGPAVDPDNEAMDWLHDGGVNVARVGMNLAKPFAWLGDRAAGVFGYSPNLQGRLQSAGPQYRNASLETNPINTGLVNFATGATGAALVAGAGLPNLAAEGISAIGAHAVSPAVAATAAAVAPAVATAGNAATVAVPWISGANSYYDQVAANESAARTAEAQRQYGPGVKVLQSSGGGTFDKVRHAVGTAANWVSGMDPYFLTDNISSM